MSDQHFTTRRGFVGAMGFGALGLYATWAAYGASPLPFSFAAGDKTTSDSHAGSGHGGGHGAPAEPVISEPAGGHGGGGLSPAEFEKRHADFLARFQQSDGSVHPGVAAAPAEAGHGASGDHGGMTDHKMPATENAGHDTAPPGAPVEVYFAAGRFSFDPDTLVLERDRVYRFYMSASDITHGAAIAFGSGSRIVRLRPGSVTTLDLTFKSAGIHLVYCTVYCGPGHDTMRGRISVA